LVAQSIGVRVGTLTPDSDPNYSDPNYSDPNYSDPNYS